MGLPTALYPLGNDNGNELYDSKIEYLESTGTQYINTGIKGNQFTVVQLEFALTDFDTSTDMPIFGVRSAWGVSQFCSYRDSSLNGQIVFNYGNNRDTSYIQSGIIGNNGNWHTAQFARACKLDNFSKTMPFYSFTTANNLLLFGFISGGTYNCGKLRVKSCKILKNSDIVRNYIPVRIGQKGYMFDKVNRTLNGGDRNFVLGPDI